MQKGFDDCREDFEKIYRHPNVGPFSYSWVERTREVIQHIEESPLLKQQRKDKIIELMKSDLKEMENWYEKKDGG